VMRRDRNDGAGHRLLKKQRSCRWIVRGVIPANLSSTRGEAASGDNKKYKRNVRRSDSSLKTITWSRHSRRIEPFCCDSRYVAQKPEGPISYSAPRPRPQHKLLRPPL